MTKSTAFKDLNQGTTLATGAQPLTPLVIEGLAEFQGSFDRLCLRAGTAAIEAMMAADVEQLCAERCDRHGERQARRWGPATPEISQTYSPNPSQLLKVCINGEISCRYR